MFVVQINEDKIKKYEKNLKYLFTRTIFDIFSRRARNTQYGLSSCNALKELSNLIELHDSLDTIEDEDDTALKHLVCEKIEEKIASNLRSKDSVVYSSTLVLLQAQEEYFNEIARKSKLDKKVIYKLYKTAVNDFKREIQPIL